MRRVRQSTVEPVFGNLIHQYDLRRMNVRGRAGAYKTMLLKYRPERQVSLAMALTRPLLAATGRAWRRIRRPKAPTGSFAKSLPKNETA